MMDSILACCNKYPMIEKNLLLPDCCCRYNGVLYWYQLGV